MISNVRPIIARVGIVAGLLLPSFAGAQDRAALLLPLPVSRDAIVMQFGTATPGVSLMSPLAFGPSWGDVFVGAGYQNKARYANFDDLSIFAGFGLGDPVDAIGIEIDLTAASPFSRLAENRYLGSAKVSRILGYGVGIAVGIEGVKLTGGVNNQEQQSVYAAVSKVIALTITGVPKDYLSSLTVNAGAGNGRFCPEKFVNGVLSGVSGCGANFFLSGGQTPAEASANLDAINRAGAQPWPLSFSYGRALQEPALQAWRGQGSNVQAAQQALLKRARLNSAAREGRYGVGMEAGG